LLKHCKALFPVGGHVVRDNTAKPRFKPVAFILVLKHFQQVAAMANDLEQVEEGRKGAAAADRLLGGPEQAPRDIQPPEEVGQSPTHSIQSPSKQQQGLAKFQAKQEREAATTGVAKAGEHDVQVKPGHLAAQEGHTAFKGVTGRLVEQQQSQAQPDQFGKPMERQQVYAQLDRLAEQLDTVNRAAFAKQVKQELEVWAAEQQGAAAEKRDEHQQQQPVETPEHQQQQPVEVPTPSPISDLPFGEWALVRLKRPVPWYVLATAKGS
jgi:hypothetical protein